MYGEVKEGVTCPVVLFGCFDLGMLPCADSSQLPLPEWPPSSCVLAI